MFSVEAGWVHTDCLYSGYYLRYLCAFVLGQILSLALKLALGQVKLVQNQLWEFWLILGK